MTTLYPILLAAALTAPGVNPVAQYAGATAEAVCPPVSATHQVRLNFRGAPLEMVLSHLAQATGYTIVLEATPQGSVDAWSNQPLTPEAALDLLDSLLLRNGLAAVRKGGTLTIINRDEAKTRAIPVKLGGNPDSIPSNDQIVTQIIPVRFVEVGKLVNNLQPLVSSHAMITANESANTLVITDTQNGIRRAAEIIHAIDAGAEDFTALRVFHLKNAVPSELVDVLTTLFPDQSQSNNNQAGQQFGGPMGGPPGMGGPGGFVGDGSSQSANSGSQRLKTSGKVNAVADDRTSSVVVSAPKDLMAQIESVVEKLDSNPARKQDLKVIQLKNARPQEVLKVLQTVFQKNTTTTQNQNNTSTTTDVLESRANSQSQTQQSRSGTSRSSGSGSSNFGSGSTGGGSFGSGN